MNASSDRLFDDSLSGLASASPETSRSTEPQDGFLFSGNRHESVPRALFLDRRLTPLERNAWQVCRMRLNGDRITALPTYAQLRPLLASMPGAMASHETVARDDAAAPDALAESRAPPARRQDGTPPG
jgi:hypothetical protein